MSNAAVQNRIPIEIKGGAESTITLIARYVEPQIKYTAKNDTTILNDFCIHTFLVKWMYFVLF
ncbi:MAG: hypothetical protein HC831_14005 [Chloroflexia bacterium]|nr:hypothetical protein [Chloroflexia bacterium]